MCWIDDLILCLSLVVRCSSSEQKQNIPEGLLKKEAKSQAQKAKDLEEVGAFTSVCLNSHIFTQPYKVN